MKKQTGTYFTRAADGTIQRTPVEFTINAGAVFYRRASGRFTPWGTAQAATPVTGWRYQWFYYYRKDDGFVYRVHISDAVRQDPAPPPEPQAEIDRLRHGLEVIRAGIGSEDRVPAFLIKRDLDHLLAGGTLPIMIAAPPDPSPEEIAAEEAAATLADANAGLEAARFVEAVAAVLLVPVAAAAIHLRQIAQGGYQDPTGGWVPVSGMNLPADLPAEFKSGLWFYQRPPKEQEEVYSFVYYCRNCGWIEQADSITNSAHRTCTPDPVTFCFCYAGQKAEAEAEGREPPAPELATAGPCPLCQDSGRARQSAIRTALGDDGGDWRADAEADYQRSIAADLRAHGFRVRD
jgi:hypothetical protein